MTRTARGGTGRSAVWLAAAALLALPGAGCVSTRACKQGTLLVTVTFKGEALSATKVLVDATAQDESPVTGSLDHTPEDATGTIEIIFPTYQQDKPISVTLTAQNGTTTLASATATSTLLAGCSTLAMTLGDGPDGGSNPGTGGDIGSGGNGTGGHVGSGGNVGAGGSIGSGGHMGVGGNSGLGGNGTGGVGAGGIGTGGRMGVGGAPPTICTGTAPTSALITDFAHATSSATGIVFPAGSLYTYNTNGTSPNAKLVAGGLEISGTVSSGSFGGVGIHLTKCADVSAYTGATFTFTGTGSNCILSFSPNAAVDDAYASNPATGDCVAPTCYSPSKANIAVGLPQTVAFAELQGGMPQPSFTVNDLTTLTSVSWGLMPASATAGDCTFDITLGNAAFVGPSATVATFDTGVGNFVLNNYDGSTTSNLYLHNQGTEPTLSWTGQEGSPSAGALEVTAPFYGYNQYVEIDNNYGMANPQNWTGKTVIIRVKVAGGVGFNPDPSDPGGVLVFVETGASYAFASNYSSIISATSAWQEVAFDPSTVNVPGWDPTQVVSFGIQFNTGGTAIPAPPTPATFFIDSVWLQ